MTSGLTLVLSERGLSDAEYAVLWHVRDTVVIPRTALADFVAKNLPNTVPAGISVEACLKAVESLVAKGLLVELTKQDVDADLARWRAEKYPVSWGVDRTRAPGDVDLSDAGFRSIEDIGRLAFPQFARTPVSGYNDETPGVIRAFGETEASCQRQVEAILARITESPWRWPPDSAMVEAIRPLGAWWYSRYELIPVGFESVLRRTST